MYFTLQAKKSMFMQVNIFGRTHRLLNSSVTRIPFYKLGFVKTKIHVDGTQKRDKIHRENCALAWHFQRIYKNKIAAETTQTSS